MGAVLGLVGRARAVAAAGIFSFAFQQRAHTTDEGVLGRRPACGSEGSVRLGRSTLRQPPPPLTDTPRVAGRPPRPPRARSVGSLQAGSPPS